MTGEYNEPEVHAQSEWKQEIANDDAARPGQWSMVTHDQCVDDNGLKESIINRMEQDWPEIRLRLAAGEAAEWLRRGAPGRALETLEAVLARYEQEESK